MSESQKEFDLIVIGGWPAGIVGATTAAAFGKTVAVVDNHQAPAQIRVPFQARRFAKRH
jgi:predicted flavoprotein YhiN